MSALPKIGAEVEISVPITAQLIDRFTALVGDDNPVHHDDEFARSLGLPGRIAHGMSYASFLSTLIGTKLPGPGSLWASQTYRFIAPAVLGDVVTLRATVTQTARASRTVTLAVEGFNQKGERLLEGESVVLVPGADGDDRAMPKRGAKRPARARPVALIAGGSGILGRAIAAALGRAGHDLALGGRDESKLKRCVADLRADLGKNGPAVLALALDLTEDRSVAAAMAEARERLGPVSVVVHCASAALPDAAPDETDWEVYRQHFEVQVGGLYRLVRSCAPDMRAAGAGQLIYIGSSASHGAPPKGLSAYTTAKAATGALIKCIALELGPYGIRANAISPYFMNTDLTARVPEKARKLAAARTPLRRNVEVEEVAAAVAFLASGETAFINGHDLLVDGGAVMA